MRASEDQAEAAAQDAYEARRAMRAADARASGAEARAVAAERLAAAARAELTSEGTSAGLGGDPGGRGPRGGGRAALARAGVAGLRRAAAPVGGRAGGAARRRPLGARGARGGAEGARLGPRLRRPHRARRRARRARLRGRALAGPALSPEPVPPIPIQMPTTTAKILTEGQVVQLDLGGKTTALPCRVLGFGGSTVMLAPVVPATAPTADAIQAGREAYVVLDDDDQCTRCARGCARAPSPARSSSRSPTRSGSASGAATRAPRSRCRPRSARSSAGETWETVTRDISPSGVRMARIGAPGEQADALSVVLQSPAAGMRIETRADVVRRSQRDLSLTLHRDLPETDIALLAQITVAYYRLAR